MKSNEDKELERMKAIDQVPLYSVKIYYYRCVIRGLALLYICFMTFMLLHPDPWSVLGFAPRGELIERAFSIVHFFIFTLFALFISFSVRRERRILWFVFALIYCLATEYIQIWTGRAFEYMDLLQNMSGVLMGYWIGWLLRNYLKRVLIKGERE